MDILFYFCLFYYKYQFPTHVLLCISTKHFYYY